MDIKYLGHSSFQIKTKTATVVTDPFDAKIGLKFPKVEADIVTVSHQHDDHNKSEQVGGDRLIVDWPGEYEKQGVRVTGFRAFHDKSKGADRGEVTMFKIEADGLSILHVGDLGHTLTEEFTAQIGAVDILMVPVGGFYTVDAGEASEVAKKLEAGIVIPMHYNNEKLDQKVFGQLTPIDDFLKKIGVPSETLPKLSVKKEDIGENMRVVVLEISS